MIQEEVETEPSWLGLRTQKGVDPREVVYRLETIGLYLRLMFFSNGITVSQIGKAFKKQQLAYTGEDLLIAYNSLDDEDEDWFLSSAYTVIGRQGNNPSLQHLSHHRRYHLLVVEEGSAVKAVLSVNRPNGTAFTVHARLEGGKTVFTLEGGDTPFFERHLEDFLHHLHDPDLVAMANAARGLENYTTE